jgi:hypothetical protein
MENSIVFNGTVDKVSTMSDGTLRIYVGTQEMPLDKMAQLFSFDKQAGYFLISKQKISKNEVTAVESVSKDVTPSKGKSPSQRLRNVLYRLWETDSPDNMEFQEFYEIKIETIITHFKTKLDVPI